MEYTRTDPVWHQCGQTRREGEKRIKNREGFLIHVSGTALGVPLSNGGILT
jgi:hypothetical protein